MPTLNEVTLMGHVGKDPEIKTTSNGKLMAKFSLATTKSYKDQSGQWQKKSFWHNITLFGYSDKRPIEKGDLVHVKGEIENREYEGKWYTDIVCTSYINMDYKKYMDSPKAPAQKEVFEDEVPF